MKKAKSDKSVRVTREAALAASMSIERRVNLPKDLKRVIFRAIVGFSIVFVGRGRDAGIDLIWASVAGLFANLIWITGLFIAEFLRIRKSEIPDKKSKVNLVDRSTWALVVSIITISVIFIMALITGANIIKPSLQLLVYDSPTPTSTSTETPTSTSTNTPTLTLTPTFTLTPTVTPWLDEEFQSTGIPDNLWEMPDCGRPYIDFSQGYGYVAYSLTSLVPDCILIPRIDDRFVRRIDVDFHLTNITDSGVDGFAGIETSCGPSTVWFQLSRRELLRQRDGDPDSKMTVRHGLDLVRALLKIVWTDDGLITFSSENEEGRTWDLGYITCSQQPRKIWLVGHQFEGNFEIRIFSVRIYGDYGTPTANE